MIPMPIIAVTGLAVLYRLLSGDFVAFKPAIFMGTVSAIAAVLFVSCLRYDVRKPIEMRMLTIVVAMPALAWTVPHLWLLFVIMCFWVPVAARRFDLIVPVYLFSLLFLPGLDYPLAIGSVKLIEFGVHNALALGAAVAIMVNPAKARCRIGWDTAVGLLVFMITMALARDTSASHHVRVFLEVSFDLILPYYILSRGLRTSEDLRAAMLWLAAGGVVISAILVFEVAKGWLVYIELDRIFSLPTIIGVKMRAGLLRAAGPFVEPTSVAMVLAICAMALYLSREFFRTRLHYFLLLAIMSAGLIAPQSRSAWIGVCIAIVAIDLVRGRYAQLAQKAFLACGMVSALFLVAQFSPRLAETMGLGGHSIETSSYRSLLLDRGLEEFAKRPIAGYSMAELEQRLPDLKQGEGIIDFVNAYIWIMLVAGLGGLVIFIGTPLYFLLGILRAGRFRGTARRDVEAGAFIFGVLVMLMEMMFFTSFGGRSSFYLLALFGFAAAFIRLQGTQGVEGVEAAATSANQPERPLRPVGTMAS